MLALSAVVPNRRDRATVIVGMKKRRFYGNKAATIVLASLRKADECLVSLAAVFVHRENGQHHATD